MRFLLKIIPVILTALFVGCPDERRCPQGSYQHEGKCLIDMDGFEINEANEVNGDQKDEEHEEETTLEH